MRLNVQPAAPKRPPQFTHEGAPAVATSAASQLRRAVMACMLWEDTFYESGVDIGQRIRELVPQVPTDTLCAIALEARSAMKLRHVPLLVVACMAAPNGPHRAAVGRLLSQVIQRADELSEFLAIYARVWGFPPSQLKPHLSAQVKKGLAEAMRKFDAHALAKYNRDGPVKLRDVLFLSHSKPAEADDPDWPYEVGIRKYAGGVVKPVVRHPDTVYRQLVDGTLATPDTWEVALSAGGDKRESFERLMAERKLGALAFLRNLRNMQGSRVDPGVVQAYSQTVDLSRVLPFRFVAAANAVPMWEPMVEAMMFRALATMERIAGPTAILIDHSGSMTAPVSAKSEVTRFDAASAVAMIVRELCDDVRVFTFSDRCIEVPARRGFGMRDAVRSVVNPVGTMLGHAVSHVYAVYPECRRLIVITDEQSADRPRQPIGRGYLLNVGGYKNGIGYGDWVTIDGWSESVLTYMQTLEAMEPDA